MQITKPNLDAFKATIHTTTNTNLTDIRGQATPSKECSQRTASIANIEKELFDAIDKVDSLIDGYNNTVSQWNP